MFGQGNEENVLKCLVQMFHDGMVGQLQFHSKWRPISFAIHKFCTVVELYIFGDYLYLYTLLIDKVVIKCNTSNYSPKLYYKLTLLYLLLRYEGLYHQLQPNMCNDRRRLICYMQVPLLVVPLHNVSANRKQGTILTK